MSPQRVEGRLGWLGQGSPGLEEFLADFRRTTKSAKNVADFPRAESRTALGYMPASKPEMGAYSYLFRASERHPY